MKKQSAQSGFAVIEAVLIVVILAIVGFVGYYVYNINGSAADTYDAAGESSSTPVITNKKTPTPAKTEDGATTTPATKSTDSSTLKSAADSANPTSTQSSQDIKDADNSLAE